MARRESPNIVLNLIVMIADDHPLIRSGLRTLLGSVADIEVVGEVVSGEEAIRQVAASQPDVILMDIQNRPESHDDHL